MRKTGVQQLSRVDIHTEEHRAGFFFPMERALMLFTMSCWDETAAHVSAQRVLCLQSCMDKAPSSPGWGMIEEDQGTAVGLVNTAVMDHWQQVSVQLARGAGSGC